MSDICDTLIPQGGHSAGSVSSGFVGSVHLAQGHFGDSGVLIADRIRSVFD